MRGSDILVHLTGAPQELQSCYHINELNESETVHSLTFR